MLQCKAKIRKFANSLLKINMKKISLLLLFLPFLGGILQAQTLRTKQAPLPCLNKKFTIVAHIARDTFGAPNLTEAEVTDQIESLNTFFEPICAAFEICEFRYIDNFQHDVVDSLEEWDEILIKHHLNNRINMFFVSDVVFEPNFCGFATLGGITMLETGGILIKKGDCFTIRTIAHEMGHYFGLLHTFEGNGTELVNGANCEIAGDLICDTPADPYTPGDDVNLYVDVGQGCRFINQSVDANGEFYRPDVGNVMSYYQEDCLCMDFTYGQYIRMANTFFNSDPKMW